MKKPKRFFTGQAPVDAEEGFHSYVPEKFPAPPPWRRFAQVPQDLTEDHRREVPKMPPSQQEAGRGYISVHTGGKGNEANAIVEMVNAALVLRRPLLLTGDPGVGKSSLAYAVAFELGLGEVLYWAINSRTTLREGQYEYDALARLQDASFSKTLEGKVAEAENVEKIGEYITLGPLGTALIPTRSGRPRVLIIDEIDKADVDLPNDLLAVLEDGEFPIRELVRIQGREGFRDVPVTPWDARRPGDDGRVTIRSGHVVCESFPLIVMTSNGEREFPPAFLRRCLRLEIDRPGPEMLVEIIRRRLRSFAADEKEKQALEETLEELSVDDALIRNFVRLRDERSKIMATDQLLQAMFLRATGMSSPLLETLTAGVPVTDTGRVRKSDGEGKA